MLLLPQAPRGLGLQAGTTLPSLGHIFNAAMVGVIYCVLMCMLESICGTSQERDLCVSSVHLLSHIQALPALPPQAAGTNRPWGLHPCCQASSWPGVVAPSAAMPAPASQLLHSSPVTELSLYVVPLGHCLGGIWSLPLPTLALSSLLPWLSPAYPTILSSYCLLHLRSSYLDLASVPLPWLLLILKS